MHEEQKVAKTFPYRVKLIYIRGKEKSALSACMGYEV